jgi:rhamnogalacturonyl hydrolase YesR
MHRNQRFSMKHGWWLRPALAVVGVALVGICGTSAKLSPNTADQIATKMKLVANWQLAHISEIAANESAETGWVQAAFYIGLARWAAQSKDRQYFESIRSLGRRNGWRLGGRLYHADDQAIGQAYAAAFDHFGDRQMIAPMLEDFDRILAHRPTVSRTFDGNGLCESRWCWCDALFMAPAAWMAASRMTGDRRYRDYADAEYWIVKKYLFDPEERLFFRDSRFFSERGPGGEKIFWSRGNGWVFAGLVNILRELPRDHPSRKSYIALFTEMAVKIASRQRPDGFWSTSLLSRPELSSAESSGTAFFVYGLASGLHMGLLKGRRFVDASWRGWEALASAVDRDGRLGRVQGVGDRPGPVLSDRSEPFAAGGFLLAGTAMLRMLPRP